MTRLPNNSALRKTVADWETKTRSAWAAQPSEDGQARHATHEFWRRAKGWNSVLRVVAVAVERAVAQTRIGELTRVNAPKLSSAQRNREGAPHRKRKVGMAENEVTLLLAAIAWQLLHALRCLLESVTSKGLSLDRVRERVLKVAACVVRHARAVHFRIASTKAALWSLLPLREALGTGDYRCLYLAWLVDVHWGVLDEEEEEPPVPPGMRDLDSAHKAFVAFMGVDPDLLEVVAEAIAPLQPREIAPAKTRVWLAARDLSSDCWRADLARASPSPTTKPSTSLRTFATSPCRRANVRPGTRDSRFCARPTTESRA